MAFLVLLRKSRDKKQCDNNVAEKWEINIVRCTQSALDFNLILDVVARKNYFQNSLCYKQPLALKPLKPLMPIPTHPPFRRYVIFELPPNG